MRPLRQSAALCILLLVIGANVWAQGVAQISGVVRDESGAVLPGVTVTVTQADTGFTRTVVTNEDGAYAMPNLVTGPYRLEAQLQGFRTFTRTGIVLQVGAAPVLNVELTIGGLEESVTVEAATPLVDVRSAGVSEVVEQERIVELPLQGRQVTDLIVLAGAAVNTGPVTNTRGRSDSTAISVAGGLRTGVTYTLDGALHNDQYDNLNLAFPFPDALQEFQVATGGLSAESGMHSGASVNAVTKSGTNRFSGNGFEFVRHHRFNATNPFAPIADGKRANDGLVRNQFGGTFGGPIIRDKLFFFGGYQGTLAHQATADNIAWVPTAAMLAGDFTARAAPVCNAGRQLTLRAPFVNNRVDPSQVSPIAKAMTKFLPTSDNPCGEIHFTAPVDSNNPQGVARIDYQLNPGQTIFGRYLVTAENTPSTFAETGNVLTVRNTYTPRRYREHSTAVGHTAVLSSNKVNSFRVTWTKGENHLNDPPVPFFDAPSLGIPVYSYVPGMMGMNVTDGFTFATGVAVRVTIDKAAYQIDDQYTWISGNHQFGLGATTSYWFVESTDYATSNATFNFLGRQTGMGLADFVVGRLDRLDHGAPSTLDMNQRYLGVFGQDSWKMTDRITVNAGLRWEPYFGQNLRNGAVSNFSLENFRKGIRSQVYKNAPVGMVFPGDPGVNTKGINTRWWNLSPRAGVAWDVTGDGRTAIRSSYAMNYDLPTGQFMYRIATGSPFSSRNNIDGQLLFEDPYRGFPGGQIHPIAQPPTADAPFSAYSSFVTIDPDINSTRVQSWNVTVERQLAGSNLVSASYLGNYIDRIWGQVPLNPGVFMGLGPCAINGVAYATCTSSTNLHQRRVLSLENPVAGQGLGPVSRIAALGQQSYGGVRLSFRHRAATGLGVDGNYTISQCEADTYYSGGFFNFDDGYQHPDDPSFDRGNCVQNRTQIANVSLTYQTPQFAAPVLGALASGWRVAGVLNARSGQWLTVLTNRDIAGTGIVGSTTTEWLQRVNQVGDDVYGANPVTNYLSRDAFAFPQPGTLGNHVKNSIEAPGFWSVDMALSRLVPLGATRTVQLRIEVFNLLNTFNLGLPETVLDLATFGRITTMTGSPRIMQFGVKYGF